MKQKIEEVKGKLIAIIATLLKNALKYMALI